MKKSLIFLVLVAISLSIYAQDVIVTKEAKKIEAKILEVSKSEVKYKDFDNQEGPTFILDIEDITTIIYANGKVVLYNQTPSQPKEEDVSSADKEAERVAQQEQARREQEREEERRQQEALDQALENSLESLRQSGEKLAETIRKSKELDNSYALDIQNTTKDPYKINLDGRTLGVVNPYKTERFIVHVSIYGKMQAVQASGYMFYPTVKEYKIPQQQKKTACKVVIK